MLAADLERLPHFIRLCAGWLLGCKRVSFQVHVLLNVSMLLPKVWMEEVDVLTWVMAMLPACGVGIFWSLLADGVKSKNGCKHVKRDSDGLLALKSQIPSPRSLHAAVSYSGGTRPWLELKKIQGPNSYSCTEQVYYIIVLLRHGDWPPAPTDEAPHIEMGMCFCCPDSWKSSKPKGSAPSWWEDGKCCFGGTIEGIWIL